MGINGSQWKWFLLYLISGLQVSIGRVKLKLLPVNSGVPHGSILGPLLFLVYIDLPPSVIKSIPLLFADDTKCLKQVCAPQDSSYLQLDLDGINKWNMQKLAFNEKKSAHITSPSQSHSNYSMDAIN